MDAKQGVLDQGIADGVAQVVGQQPSRRGIFARGAGPTAAELSHGLLVAGQALGNPYYSWLR